MRNEPGCMDLRQWMDLLDREGELHRIAAPVSWDREIGTISRKVLERKGPALLFENIRGYENARGASSPAALARASGSRWRSAFRRTPATARSSNM